MNNLKFHVIQFITMIVVGMLFNPMNMLAYDVNHIYLSLTLFYGGILMASNMIWSHEVVHFLSMGHINIYVLMLGVILSIMTTLFLLRRQTLVNDKQWLRRMISHHSTALTTSQIIKNNTNNPEIKKLAKEIISTQKKEINTMKRLLEE